MSEHRYLLHLLHLSLSLGCRNYRALVLKNKAKYLSDAAERLCHLCFFELHHVVKLECSTIFYCNNAYINQEECIMHATERRRLEFW